MSLSVEELWKLYYSLEERADGLLRIDEAVAGEDGVEAALALRNDLIDAMHVIRTLIAIKEAEPVAHVVAVTGSDARSISANPDGEFFRLPHGTPLIRKPE